MRIPVKSNQPTCDSRIHSSAGFTLIEVILAIGILAIVMTLTAISIQGALRNKRTIQTQIDDVSRLRDAVRVMERDIQLAFHYKDLEKEIEDLAKAIKTDDKKKNNTPPTTTPPTTTSPGDPNADKANEIKREVERENPETHFLGANEKLNFVTSNSPRMAQGQRQADYIEVGYELRDCRSADDESSSKCLIRRSSPVVDKDVDKGGTEDVLLENISEFDLKYFGKGKQDWVEDWKTDNGGDAATKGKFPLAVEVSIKIVKKNSGSKGKGKTYSLNVVVPIHFPNNIEKPTAAANGAGTGATSGTSNGAGPGGGI